MFKFIQIIHDMSISDVCLFSAQRIVADYQQLGVIYYKWFELLSFQCYSLMKLLLYENYPALEFVFFLIEEFEYRRIRVLYAILWTDLSLCLSLSLTLYVARALISAHFNAIDLHWQSVFIESVLIEMCHLNLPRKDCGSEWFLSCRINECN